MQTSFVVCDSALELQAIFNCPMCLKAQVICCHLGHLWWFQEGLQEKAIQFHLLEYLVLIFCEEPLIP